MYNKIQVRCFCNAATNFWRNIWVLHWVWRMQKIQIYTRKVSNWAIFSTELLKCEKQKNEIRWKKDVVFWQNLVENCLRTIFVATVFQMEKDSIYWKRITHEIRGCEKEENDSCFKIIFSSPLTLCVCVFIRVYSKLYLRCCKLPQNFLSE